MTETTTRRERRARSRGFTLTRRRWAYGVLLAAGGVALAYGIVDTDKLGAWLVLGAALLGVGGTALANPTKD